MKKVSPLLLIAAFTANAAAQSGRKIVRPPTQPDPPVQAPVWSQPDPDPDPVPAPAPAARVELSALPESLLQRSLKSLDNSSFRLADFDGKVVVVTSGRRGAAHAVRKFQSTRKCARSTPAATSSSSL